LPKVKAKAKDQGANPKRRYRKHPKSIPLFGSVSANRTYTVVNPNPAEDPHSSNIVNPGLQSKTGGRNKKRVHYSAPINMGIRSNFFPEVPRQSPISKTGWGKKLAQRLEIQFSAGSQTLVDAGLAADTNVKILSEEELVAKFGTKNISTKFESPYDDIDLVRFHDCGRSDGACRHAVNIKTNYIAGKFTNTSLDVNFTITDDEERKKAVKTIHDNKLFQGLKAELDQIDQDISFNKVYKALIKNREYFGRAAALVERDEDGIPLAIKILSSMSLGKNYYNSKTWEIVGVEYKEFSKRNNKNIIPATDLIYITAEDDHHTPNTYGYGLARVETVADTVERNVILNQLDLKEGNRDAWQPKLLVTVKGSDDLDDLENLKTAFEQSGSAFTLEDATAQVLDQRVNIGELMDELDQNDQKITRDMGVPTPLGGFENSQIRAATSQVVTAWTQSDIATYRVELEDPIIKQWHERNMQAIIKRRLKRIGNPTFEESQRIEQEKAQQTQQQQDQQQDQEASNPDQDQEAAVANNTTIETLPGQKFDENGAEIVPDIDIKSIRQLALVAEEPKRWPFKITIHYETITIISLLEMAASVMGLKTARIINNMKAWKLLDFQDLVDDPPPDLVDMNPLDMTAGGPGQTGGGGFPPGAAAGGPQTLQQLQQAKGQDLGLSRIMNKLNKTKLPTAKTQSTD
jgi:hypothetical protein